MINLFNKSRILWLVLRICAFAAMITSLFYTALTLRELWASLGISVGIFTLFIISSSIVSTKISFNERAKISDILNNECDPERYIAEIEKLRRIPCKEVTKTHLKLCMVCGLNDAGRIHEANSLIESINYSPESAMGLSNLAFYYYLSATVKLDLGSIDEAEKTLGKYKKLLGNGKTFRKIRQQYFEAYENLAASIELHKGNFDGMEERFKLLFDNAAFELSRVGAKYHLGETYLHFGRLEEAKDAWQYVIEHGNRLHIVSLARELMKKSQE